MIALVLALALLDSSASVQDQLAWKECPASVMVLGREPGNALGISATLVTREPSEVYIVDWPRPGFRVIRSESDEDGQAVPKAELIEAQTRKIRRHYSQYDFRHPHEIRVWWTDVGYQPSVGSSKFVVPIGWYRFSIVFSVSDPDLAQTKTLNLCRVYSTPFLVNEPSGFLALP